MLLANNSFTQPRLAGESGRWECSDQIEALKKQHFITRGHQSYRVYKNNDQIWHLFQRRQKA